MEGNPDLPYEFVKQAVIAQAPKKADKHRLRLLL